MPELMSRRKFAELFAAASVTGTALLETMLAEAQRREGLSRESVLAVGELADLELSDDQVAPLRKSLEDFLSSVKQIRDRDVPQSVEPATMFRVRE